MISKLLLPVAVIATAATMFTSQAAGAGVWSPPTNISGGKFRNLEPRVAIRPGGEAVSLWFGQFVVPTQKSYWAQSSWRAPGGAWSSPPDEISPEGGYHPDFGLAKDGSAVVVWTEDSDAEFPYLESMVRSGTTWSTPERITEWVAPGGGAYFPKVAVNEGGEAVAAWQQCYTTEVLESAAELECFEGEGEYRIDVAVRGGAGWSLPDRLSTGSENAIKVQSAIDAAGDVAVIWEDGKASRIHVATRPAGTSTWSQKVLSPEGAPAGEPQLAYDAAGNLTALWHSQNPSYQVESATLPHGSGTWSSVDVLSSALLDAFEPDLAVNAQGDAVAVWRLKGGSSNAIATAARSGSLWGAEEVLAPEVTEAREPRIALNAGGEAVAVWRRLDGSTRSIEASVRDAGAWTPASTLSTPGTDSVEPELAIAPDGRAVAIWRTQTASGLPQLVETTEFAPDSKATPPVSVPGGARHALASSARRALVKGGQARVLLRCGKAGPCKGSIELTKGKRKLGAAAFREASGAVRIVSVRLNRHGRTLLKASGGQLTVHLSGPGVRSRSLLLEQA